MKSLPFLSDGRSDLSNESTQSIFTHFEKIRCQYPIQNSIVQKWTNILKHGYDNLY